MQRPSFRASLWRAGRFLCVLWLAAAGAVRAEGAGAVYGAVRLRGDRDLAPYEFLRLDLALREVKDRGEFDRILDRWSTTRIRTASEDAISAAAWSRCAAGTGSIRDAAGRYCLAPLTDALSPLPGTNFTVLLAAIMIASPVCGLRPGRCALSERLKLPNPGIATSPPRASSSETILTKASRDLEAAACDCSVAMASACTSSVLFIVRFLLVEEKDVECRRRAARQYPSALRCPGRPRSSAHDQWLCQIQALCASDPITSSAACTTSSWVSWTGTLPRPSAKFTAV